MTRPATVSIDLPGAPGAVWAAITDPDRLAGWFWPPRLAPVVRLAGPAFEIAGEGIAVGGRVLAVDPGRRLELDWRWAGEAAGSTVAVELEPRGAGTRVTVRHAGLADEAAVADHERGWRDCLTRLAAALSVAG
ncbi:SRPBCC domain-containing protein [Kitasatospora sp. NPDC058965]|uniref:SRPBCC family protein n=1 Tax=Kitasatospora sp. NPDC058965 TaxID=3346682 RepID=UPI0036857743